MRVDGLSGQHFEEVSFVALRGEIVGIAGIVGNGQRALLRAVRGSIGRAGEVEVGGKQISRERCGARPRSCPRTG